MKARVTAGLLELLGETHAKDLTLETVLGSELVKVMEMQNRVPWHVRYTKLTADGVNLVMDIVGSASAIVGNLRGVVTSNAYFGQHGHVLLERKVLADSPVEGKPVARCKVEILLFPHVSYAKAVTTAVALLAIGYHAIEPCTCCSQKPHPMLSIDSTVTERPIRGRVIVCVLYLPTGAENP